MRPARPAPAAPLIAPLLLAALALGCRSEQERAEDALAERVKATFENTPEHLRTEVLRTCDKWRRIDESRACRDAEARHDQFECWLEAGYPKLEHGYQYQLRPRARDHTTLLKLDHCMELRRWRLIHGRRKTYQHLFGARGQERTP